MLTARLLAACFSFLSCSNCFSNNSLACSSAALSDNALSAAAFIC